MGKFEVNSEINKIVKSHLKQKDKLLQEYISYIFWDEETNTRVIPVSAIESLIKQAAEYDVYAGELTIDYSKVKWHKDLFWKTMNSYYNKGDDKNE